MAIISMPDGSAGVGGHARGTGVDYTWINNNRYTEYQS